jgi:hypothetical protein
MTIIITKNFIEKTDDDFENYNKMWSENRHRMVFLQKNVTSHVNIVPEITCDKDILAIRFPTEHYINNNRLLKNIRFGIGIPYQEYPENQETKIWLPKEIWIYSMF